MSQLLRGFTKEVSKVDEVDVDVLTKAFERAVESAYKAVMKPKEGTILTVARGGADKAIELNGRTDNIAEFMNSVIMHMRDVLEQTPELLPVLKEAGVVDSGGEGLVTVLEGAYTALIGKEVKIDVEPAATPVKKPSMGADAGVVAEADIKSHLEGKKKWNLRHFWNPLVIRLSVLPMRKLLKFMCTQTTRVLRFRKRLPMVL